MTVVLISSCSSPEEGPYQLAGNALGTTYHITYIGKEIQSFENKVDSMIGVINHALSTYDTTSFISAFNASNHSVIDSVFYLQFGAADLYHFNKMVQMSKDISTQTEGAFDPSAALLYQEYVRAQSANLPMNDSIVRHCLLHQGMSHITWKDKDVPTKSDAFVQLNFNAIAKGYLVDIVADYLTRYGISRFMVEIGGEMRLQGLNLEGYPWRVGINTPLISASSSDFFEVLELKNTALATSGNYQNFYFVNDSLVGHTLNPSTGKPVIHNLKSASIMHHQCAVADAMATACMVVGLEKSREFIASDSSLKAYFIYEEGDRLMGEFVE